MKNTQKVAVKICFSILFLAIFLILLAFVMDIHPAITFLSIFVGVTSFIVGLLFQTRKRCMDEMLSGQGLIASWIYSEEDTVEYINQVKEDKEGSGILAYFGLSFLAVLIMIIVAIAAYDDFNMGFLVAFIIIVIDVIVFLITATINKHKGERIKKIAKLNHKQQGFRYVYISKDGLYAHNILHVWKGWGSRLESVLYDQNEENFYFTYRYLSAYIYGSYTCELKIPNGYDAQKTLIYHSFDVKTR